MKSMQNDIRDVCSTDDFLTFWIFADFANFADSPYFADFADFADSVRTDSIEDLRC